MIFIAARLGQVIQIILYRCASPKTFTFTKNLGGGGGVGRTEKDMPAISPI